MAESIRYWAEKEKLPYEMVKQTLVDAGLDSSCDQLSEKDWKKYRKDILKARLAARKGSGAPAATAVAEPKSSVPVEAPSALGGEVESLERARKAAQERERRVREEAAEKAREESEKRAIETARKLEAEQPAPAVLDQPQIPPKPARGRASAAGSRQRPARRQPQRRRRNVSRGPTELELQSRQHLQDRAEQGEDEIQIQARDIEIPEIIQVSELAHRMSMKASVVLKTLVELGVVATASQVIDQDTAVLAVSEIGHNPVPVQDRAAEEKLEQYLASDSPSEPRSPVVTVMGHVDHGKTSLLDYIRKTRLAGEEAGGITQHIGAWQIPTAKGPITFLDTPGHAAFTALRARGAQATDIVVLVVAADDGVMPQTEEAAEHARAAGVPVIVAINKIDRPRAEPDKVRQQLAAINLQVEGWGGEVQSVEVSAETGEGIDKLLEAIALEAEIRELKSPVTGPAQGLILEATMTTGRGPVATLLVQSGTLKTGDLILAGDQEVRVRAMTDSEGRRLKQAGPSMPVEILGFDTVPDAGLHFAAVKDARLRREVLDYRHRIRDSHKALKDKVGLEAFFVEAQDKKVLNLVLKADVRGSLEAIQDALGRLGADQIKVQVVSGGVGGISESDVSLSQATDALIIGFQVRADAQAKKAARELGVDIRYYSTIYALIEDMENVLTGMLEPELHEEILGTAAVREVFESSSFGMIAGSIVEEGRIHRDQPVRVLRDNKVIFEGELNSLRRFKDDVKEVKEGTECGIGIKNYKDIRVGDRIEVFAVRAVESRLVETA